jgi:Bax protein
MRSSLTFTPKCAPIVVCAALLAACSDGRDRQPPNMLADTGLLVGCDAIASDARSAAWTHRLAQRPQFLRSQLLLVEEAEAVQQHFAEIGYDVDDVRTDLQPVPRVYLARLPTDLPEIDETRTRKQVFLASLLPAILQVNEELREVRRKLTLVAACQQSGYALSQPVRDWVAGLGSYYRTKPDAATLLIKVAEIPASMALAQAAVESGWGTSAPAQEAGNLFGQYMVVENAKGRNKKPKIQLASFDSVLAAVRSYADNLNTHLAYAEFRERRSQMLDRGLSLDGMKLAETLGAYSKRRAGYIRDVQTMIRRNHLDAFDRVDLASRHDILMN